MIRSQLVSALLAVSALTIVGCGGDKPAPKTSEEVVSKTSSKRLPDKAPDSPEASAVHISPEILKACGIKESDAYFAFDSTNLRDDDVRVLTAVAKCFSTGGALGGRTMNLVGHADPRGSAEYNMTLGQSRADAVAGYIVGKGVEKSHAQTTTRGAMDASGSDEPGWAKDRRVDILLVN